MFLPGCYDEWALTSREELQAACVDLCDQAAAYHEQRGDVQAAIALEVRRVALQPLEEQGYQRLMRLQRLAGDRAGAIRTFHRCASVLEQELGVPPAPETQREVDALLADAVALPDRAGTGGATKPMGPGAPDLVGREREQGRLRELWSTSSAGSRLVLVTGEAGIGKTRLVADLAAAVTRSGGVVASARCFAATTGLPLAPVAEWLRSRHLRLSASRLDPVWRAEVERLVPVGGVEPREPGHSSRAMVDAWQRLRFFEGLARTVLTVDRPLLLVVDDLQWCDNATLSWLSFLLSYPTTAPLMVVGTAREEEPYTDRWPDSRKSMQAAGQLVTLRLGPLSTSATAELATFVVDQPLSEEQLGLVHSVTAGNPFYVIEALREANGSPGPVEPDDLRGVLKGRFARLSEQALQVLGLAAAVGRDFDLELLTEACDLEPDTVVDLIDELWRSRILDQLGSGYDFTHSLLRDAAYDAVAPARRWLLHRRLAQALELLRGGRSDDADAQLAEQYDRSGQAERAIPFYDRAARHAASVFAHPESVRLWERCWALMAGTPAGRGRDRRELALIEQLLPPLNAWRGYSSPELESYERRSYELGTRLSLLPVQTSASIALFATTFVQGHTSESHGWALEALALSERCPDLAAQAHMAVGGSALSLGKVIDASEHLARSCALAGEMDSLPIGTRTKVHAGAWGAHALWLLGQEDQARVQCEDAVRLAESIEHPYSLAVALSYAVMTHQMRGDLAALEKDLVELTAVCERYEFAYYGQWAVVLAGWLRGGEAGIEQARQGIRNLEREGSFARMPYWFWLLADLHRSAGDRDAASATLDAAESLAVQNADVWWLPEVLRSRAALDPSPRGTDCLRRASAMAVTHASAGLLAAV